MSDLQSAYYGNTVSATDEPNEARSVSQSGSDSDDAGERNGVGKRKRPMNVTCEACKQRKVKCDRVQPSCGWCVRNDHRCEYRERKKPGLRAGYGRELESRLDRLEVLLHDHASRLNSHLQDACPVVGPDSSIHRYGRAVPVQRSMVDPKLHSPMLQSQTLPLSTDQTAVLNPLSNQAQNYHTPSAHSHALTSPHPAGTFQQRPLSVPSEPISLLPPYDLLYALVELYFKHVNVWLPLLERKTTLETFFGQSSLTEGDRVLLHAIVATTLRFSSDPRLTVESRQHYHTTSKQRVQLFGLDNSTVRSLQALVILALDVTGTANGPPGWNLLSLISRSVVQLGLSVEGTSSLAGPLYPSIATLRATVLPESKSCIEDEERRRLFWGVYLLDRYATVATAFEFALDEKEIDRKLPCRDDLFSMNKPVETRWFGRPDRTVYATNVTDIHGPFSYHCELLGILGKVHQFLKRPIHIGSVADVEQWRGSYRELDSELNAWHFSLPEDFANISRLIETNTTAKATNCGWIMLHAAYCLTVIRLNSSAAYPSSTSPIFSSSYSATQRCLSAVGNLKLLGGLVKASSLLDKVGPPFAFSAWVSARVMLVHGSTTDHEVDPDIDFFVSLLAEMGRYWNVAQRYSDILNRVLEEYRTSQTQGPVKRSTPSTVQILADMRRCAYDLDLLISRQPHSAVKSYHPTRANTPAPNELEYLDVFDFFNFPRLPLPADGTDDGQGQRVDPGAVSDLSAWQGAITIPNFAVPNPDTDWLFHST